ncbi:hypothetical protein G7Z17_g2838 [Cylindrodendrum hubeiense]|uniref:Uncharacterized protein n=1 Tax=Cylindrodendrum hubeiense TaxID=595255 RepID=A0A9P5LJY3_9HYPO|nr:hypothetical protein G7Z17_g2838 [Cylindrodendrum hubeiense]
MAKTSTISLRRLDPAPGQPGCVTTTHQDSLKLYPVLRSTNPVENGYLPVARDGIGLLLCGLAASGHPSAEEMWRQRPGRPDLAVSGGCGGSQRRLSAEGLAPDKRVRNGRGDSGENCASRCQVQERVDRRG